VTRVVTTHCNNPIWSEGIQCDPRDPLSLGLPAMACTVNARANDLACRNAGPPQVGIRGIFNAVQSLLGAGVDLSPLLVVV
jgi:hypothetical protein